MPSYVVLLRSVNVGGSNRLTMADLRSVLAGLGHADVATLIQSGNAVFTGDGTVGPGELGAAIEAALEERCGFRPAATVRAGRQLRRIVEGNPFAHLGEDRLHVAFMVRPVEEAVVARLPRGAGAAGEQLGATGEQFAVVDQEVYLHLPDGVGRSKLPARLERRIGSPLTLRNWRTVRKLCEMAADNQ